MPLVAWHSVAQTSGSVLGRALSDIMAVVARCRTDSVIESYTSAVFQALFRTLNHELLMSRVQRVAQTGAVK